MEAVCTMVIKVKYGDLVRRFNVRIVDEELDISVDGLKGKILSHFSLAPCTELILTYIDEDGDVVTLVDADDLRDVVKQGLDPLKITAKLISEENASPTMQRPLQILHDAISGVLRNVPEPLCETLTKLSVDLTYKASSSAPSITELADCFLKIGSFYLDQLSESQTATKPSSNSDGPAQTKAKEIDTAKVNVEIPKVQENEREQPSFNSNDSLTTKLQHEETMENNKETSSSKALGLKAASSALDCRNSNVGKNEKANVQENDREEPYFNCNDNLRTKIQHEETMQNNKETSSSKALGLKAASSALDCRNSNVEEKPRESSRLYSNPPSFGNNVPTEKEVNEPNVGPTHGSITALDVWMQCLVPDGWVVRCNGCGIHPINGAQFKSKLKVGYNLCDVCFPVIGNDIDYVMIDCPVVHRKLIPSILYYDPVCSKVPRKSSCASTKLKLDSCFIEDVTVIDGTIMAPLNPFTKIWRIRNNGIGVWPQKTRLVWTDGDRLNDQFSVEIEIPAAGFPVDQDLDVAVDLVAPEIPGPYYSYWRMVSPSGIKFGQRVWILIEVDASVKETTPEIVKGLNLNSPPASSNLTGCEIITANAELILEDSKPEPDESKTAMNIVEPVVDLQLNNFQEMTFPDNDSSAPLSSPSVQSLVFPMVDRPPSPAPVASSEESALHLTKEKDGVGASSAVLFAGVSVHSPVVRMPNSSAPSAPISSSQESAFELPGKEEEAEKLLEELKETSFKQVGLNKETWRMFEYIEPGLDNLSSVSKRDDIEGLEERGMLNRLVKKILLKKNK